MAKHPRSDGDDEDPSLMAFQAQKRILQLKRERDESVQATVAEADAALDDLRSRIAAHHEELQRKRAEEWASGVMKMVDVVEKRMAIEARMVEVVSNMEALIKELEEMMVVGYDGRLLDAKSSREKMMGRRR